MQRGLPLLASLHANGELLHHSQIIADDDGARSNGDAHATPHLTSNRDIAVDKLVQASVMDEETASMIYDMIYDEWASSPEELVPFLMFFLNHWFFFFDFFFFSFF